MSKFLQSFELSLKWEEYRNGVYTLFTRSDKATGVMEYNVRMGMLQQVIKGYCDKHNVEIVPAVMALCMAEEDPRYKVQILAAGYELTRENDLTAHYSPPAQVCDPA